MKVNFNKPFTDCFGKSIEGKNISEQVCMSLFNLSTLSGTPVPADKKYMAYSLCNRISSSPDEVEMSTEEASFLKEVCNENYSAGAYGQIVDMVEGASK